MSEWIPHCLLVFLVNFLVGCAVLCYVDDEDRRLFKWYRDAPELVAWLVPTLWPIVLYLWYRDN